MTQLSLFDPPRARATDPQTSHQAAGELNLGLAQRRAYDAAKVLLQTQENVTANEIAAWAAEAFDCLSESVRKRAHELVAAGYLREGPARRCTVTGKNCGTYTLVK